MTPAKKPGRLLAIVGIWAAMGLAVPARGQAPSAAARPPGAVTPTREAAPATDDPDQLTKEQREKRLLRVKRRAAERAKSRAIRRADRRRALKRRLGRVLEDRPLPAAVRGELQQHARRVAKLRRIREVAAEENDITTVMRVDRVLAREVLRHERWWTQTLPSLVGAPEPRP